MKKYLVCFLTVVLIGLSIYFVTNWLHPRAATLSESETVTVTHTTYPLRSIYKTNSWFSSAYQFPSQPMFAYPAAYQVTEKGMGISIPNVVTKEKTIFGSYDELCSITDQPKIMKSFVKGYGDWNVVVQVGDSLTFNLVQGSPVTYFNGAKEISVSCRGAVVSKKNNGVLVKRGESVMYIESQGSNVVNFKNENEFSLSAVSAEWRINVLPNDADETVGLFSDALWNPIVGTEITYSVDKTVESKWVFYKLHSDPIFTTVWPHHGDVRGAEFVDNLLYKTILGNLRLARTSEFYVERVIPDLPFTFSKTALSENNSKIVDAIKDDAARLLKDTPPAGVYFKGTWLGSVTSLIQLSDLYGMTDVRDQLIAKLEPILQQALTEFTYDEKLHLLRAVNAEFGNEQGNDHHFHYGYYIRAAAILVRYKPTDLSWSRERIEQMIEDIASEDRGADAKYPVLRSFSTYEGHSWADGKAGFADGNNQESTSEALNAWYAIRLWGDVTENPDLVDRGTWLFAEELSGTSAYWFSKNNVLSAEYAYPLTSLVWGGKRDFATWFSADPLQVIGIQLLPITPASNYLRTVGDSARIKRFVSSLQLPLSKTDWSDLYFSYLALSDPTYRFDPSNTPGKFDGVLLKSLFYQTVLK